MYMQFILSELLSHRKKLHVFRTETAPYAELQRVIKMVQDGWPSEICQTPNIARKYWDVQRTHVLTVYSSRTHDLLF